MRTRQKFLRWLRRTHAWVGLWGAMLGLLFGATGILLNHRHTMQLSLAQMEASHVELALPVAGLPDAAALAIWLQQELVIHHEPFKVTSEPAKIVTWGGKPVAQPALWKVDFHNPQRSIVAEYRVGNHFVSVNRQDANAFAFLTRLHKGVGMSVGWILLADSLGGGLILLSITGILLWSEMRRSRLILAGLTGTSLVLVCLLTLQSV